ncbi:hypothetical protein BRADI_2g37222v3 [Brachypodium distachyon]|uniref:Uncharacterized protein n=1 Tax=Brachypodium distachyon TaxID=15368 RepID=A0A2K2DCA8_BRADI|nr:hypothetical protein BRADI_2g37222v3 [Brachypodium distachyon]
MQESLRPSNGNKISCVHHVFSPINFPPVLPLSIDRDYGTIMGAQIHGAIQEDTLWTTKKNSPPRPPMINASPSSCLRRIDRHLYEFAKRIRQALREKPALPKARNLRQSLCRRLFLRATGKGRRHGALPAKPSLPAALSRALRQKLCRRPKERPLAKKRQSRHALRKTDGHVNTALPEAKKEAAAKKIGERKKKKNPPRRFTPPAAAPRRAPPPAASRHCCARRCIPPVAAPRCAPPPAAAPRYVPPTAAPCRPLHLAKPPVAPALMPRCCRPARSPVHLPLPLRLAPPVAASQKLRRPAASAVAAPPATARVEREREGGGRGSDALLLLLLPLPLAPHCPKPLLPLAPRRRALAGGRGGAPAPGRRDRGQAHKERTGCCLPAAAHRPQRAEVAGGGRQHLERGESREEKELCAAERREQGGGRRRRDKR